MEQFDNNGFEIFKLSVGEFTAIRYILMLLVIFIHFVTLKISYKNFMNISFHYDLLGISL